MAGQESQSAVLCSLIFGCRSLRVHSWHRLIDAATYETFVSGLGLGKSGWDCFGVAYAKPSVNIKIRNLNCHGRYAGIAIGPR